MTMPVDPLAASALPAALRDAICQRLAGDLALPLPSDTATRVLAACQDERADMEDLADIILHDQSMAAHVLRVANSVGYAPRAPILSLQQAIGRVGLAAVADVAIAVALQERVFSVPGHEERIRSLWLHSAATACYAKEIAEMRRGDLDSAFLCGLLHDVGMPITMQIVCDLVRGGLVAPVSPEVMELAMAEFHCEVGARMAESWKLGPWITSVIRHHHDPSSAKFRADEIPLIALADTLAYWALDEDKGDADFPIEPHQLEPLHLHEGAYHSLLRRRDRVLLSLSVFA